MTRATDLPQDRPIVRAGNGRPPVWTWLVAASLLAAVVIAVLQRSEIETFVALAREARPLWILAACLLQGGTYVAQGEIWRRTGIAAGNQVSWRDGWRLSLAKLFVDQVVPSGGVSGSVLVTKALDRLGVPTAASHAAVILNQASHYTAYAMGLVTALLIVTGGGRLHAVTVLLSLAFTVICIVLTVVLIALAGRTAPGGLARVRPLRAVLGFLSSADRGLVRRPRLLATAVGWQLAIIALDAATMLALIWSLGGAASVLSVYGSVMSSSLFRTFGLLPGGLGTFEATSTLTLSLAGVPVAVALAATLLFRGLSFWLPMLLGWWCSRRMLGGSRPSEQSDVEDGYWALPVETLFSRLGSGVTGLSTVAAGTRWRESRGPTPHVVWPGFGVLWRQISNPLLLLLVFAATVSMLTSAWSDAVIVLVIVVASVAVGYRRESRAEQAARSLRARVRAGARVVRDGLEREVDPDTVVPGDVIVLAAGAIVPADAVLLEAADCHVSEAALTGESFPVEKRPGLAAALAGVAARSNCVLQGTNVRSGTARALVVRTGGKTELGRLARHLTRAAPETSFDRGIRRFGYLLTSVMVVIVVIVFAIHVIRGNRGVDTLLFAVALAVGLSPELLPAILTLSLARGARMMARAGVLVRRLGAIENLGSIDVLCTDKTGTLTEGVVRLEGAYDETGAPSTRVLQYGWLNAAFESGFRNPLDEAILQAQVADGSDCVKRAEIPFDFVRKRVSVIVGRAGSVELITKGAVSSVLTVCTRLADGTAIDDRRRAALEQQYDGWSRQGVRVLAVAHRVIDERPRYGREDEQSLTFLGFLTFLDRPKEGVTEAIADLAKLGVGIKLVTGDTTLVARHLAGAIGIGADRVLTGAALRSLDAAALRRAVEQTDIFAEVDPNQKERIILALKQAGHIVGFLGDGVNDAAAMHVADTSLSVEHAVDVAREAADFVLLDRNLDVIRRGIEEGRRTFVNTLKYILTTTSANLGNMISMAAVSLFLPFLPLLAGQILLNNLLSDVPAVGIADDDVDPEQVERPPRWDIGFVGRFMAGFGLLSSLFDLATFAVLLWGYRVGVETFRTGWFVESLLTELAVVFVVRTRRSLFRSSPGRLLLTTSVAMAAVAIMIPYAPFAWLIGFVPLPPTLLLALIAITGLYVWAAEVGKSGFYRHAGRIV
jgi:Mg2+-importing ATPase